jgi:arylsulfatase A
LIIKLPGGNHGGRRIDTPVEAIDVAPTILSLLELPVPEIMQGQTLVPLFGEGAAIPDKDPLIFSWARNSSSITQGEWKLVTGAIGDRDALYNLSDDPGEQHNLIRQENRIARRLRQLLKEQRHRNRAIADRMSASGPTPTDGFSDEERKKLELLGYVE